MGWKDLLQRQDETLVSPWVGGRSLRSGARAWTIDGRLPRELGWYSFKLTGRTARVAAPADPAPETLGQRVRGYLVGDRIVADDADIDPDPAHIASVSEPVFLLEPGLDRFVRVSAGRTHEDGALVYCGIEMPLGPEDDVLSALLGLTGQAAAAGAWSIAPIKGVTPALDAAYRMEVLQRAEAYRRRVEMERVRREEEERRAREQRRAELVAQLGDGAGRRGMARIDFEQAARAALAVGGAEYLDHRRSPLPREMVVRFRFGNRRFECTCDAVTLRIIDAGICLVDHRTGDKGDDRFTLESLPAVIREAQAARRLVVFRHVDARGEDP
jgi:hypothetical protein